MYFNSFIQPEVYNTLNCESEIAHCATVYVYSIISIPEFIKVLNHSNFIVISIFIFDVYYMNIYTLNIFQDRMDIFLLLFVKMRLFCLQYKISFNLFLFSLRVALINFFYKDKLCY